MSGNNLFIQGGFMNQPAFSGLTYMKSDISLTLSRNPLHLIMLQLELC